MTVQAILNVKGSDVVSVLPDERVGAAVQTMRPSRRAVLVRDPVGAVLGILSERDVMRGIARRRRLPRRGGRDAGDPRRRLLPPAGWHQPRHGPHDPRERLSGTCR